jgi:quercetin dioxygenase-like cupin family protein
MKSRKQFRLLIPCLAIIFMVACNQKKDEGKTTTTADTTTTKTTGTDMPGFDASMDATKMPGYPATVVADSLGLKPYMFLANPGDSISMHHHPDHVIYVVEGGTFRISPKDKEPFEAEFKTGATMIFGPEAHSGKNIGTTPIKLLIVHVYRPRG